jgi:plasmid stabilization system protein ParE
VILKPEAAADIVEAVLWYEARRKGLGRRFQSAVDQSLERIGSMPGLHPVVHRHVRCALTPGFPFCVYYRVVDREIVVFAVMHARRDSNRWRSRI